MDTNVTTLTACPADGALLHYHVLTDRWMSTLTKANDAKSLNS